MTALAEVGHIRELEVSDDRAAMDFAEFLSPPGTVVEVWRLIEKIEKSDTRLH